MRRYIGAWIAVLFLAAPGASLADLSSDPQQHDHGPVDLGKLGKVEFAVACDDGVLAEFSRAVAMMHSFWYVEAEKTFRSVARRDPQCAMAQWGIAMANYHPIWAPPTPDEFKRGREAAENALAMTAGSDRERRWIEAIHAFYADAENADHAARAKRFEEAMAKVAAAYPKDDEASIFYALSLLGTASPNDKSYANQKKAAEILNRILPRLPEHPGIAHYVIHSFDYPSLAHLALDAARAYMKIAPGSPHALHMPSHIFTRLGLWDESIASNIASAEKARRYAQQVNPRLASFDELHAIDYLVYAYLQQGDDARAQALLAKLNAVDGESIDNANFAAAYALATAPGRWALERRAWKEAAALELRPANFNWKSFSYAEANLHFAKAIGAARVSDLNSAKAAIDRLDEIHTNLLEQNNGYWAGQVDIQRTAARAWLAQAAGLRDEAARLMRSAADLEDETEKHPVTPGPIVPARELLADLLLEQGKPAEALVEVETSLVSSPKRFHGILLAANAAEASGNIPLATKHKESLTTLAVKHSDRPELQTVRMNLK